MKLRESDAIVARGEMFRIAPSKLLVESGFNIRDLDAASERDELDILKEDIRINGVQVPLEVRLSGEEVYITSGHRRHKVVMELIAEGVEIDSIPAIAEPKTVNDAERVLRLHTLNSGKPLSSLQKAEIVRRLLGFGWERAKIANRMGFKTEQQIANFELLLAAPAEVMDAVKSGELSASSAVAMVRQSNGNGHAAVKQLNDARQEAKARGKGKVTQGAVAAAQKTPKRHRQAQAAVVPEAPRNDQGDLEKALYLLRKVIDNGWEQGVAASVYTAQEPTHIGEIADWLYVFADKLREKAEERAEAAKAQVQRIIAAE